MKSYLRFLSRNKLYTAIEVVGLSIALTFVVIFTCYTRQQFAVCSHYPGSENIYLIGIGENTYSYHSLAEEIEAGIPEVEEAVVVSSFYNSFTYEGEISSQSGLLVISDDFFDVFETGFITGSRADFDVNGNALVTRSFALRNGMEEVIGKKLTDGRKEFVISGIIEDFTGSVFKNFEIILNNKHIKTSSRQENYIDSATKTFVKVNDGSDIDSFEGKINDILQKYYDRIQYKDKDPAVLIRVDRLYFSDINNGMTGLKKEEKDKVIILSIAVLLLLTSAIINYVNLNIASAERREKEMALRHLLGAERRHIRIRTLIESFAFTAITFITAIALAIPISGFVNDLLQPEVALKISYSPDYIIIYCLMVFLISAVCGLAVAATTSRIRITSSAKTGKSMASLLMGIQFILSFIMISIALTMETQMQYMIDRDMNANLDNLYRTIFTHPELEQRVKELPFVRSVGKASGYPGNFGMTSQGDADTPAMGILICDTAAFRMFGFEVIQDFNNGDPSGTWISESLANHYGINEGNLKWPAPGFNRISENVSGIIKDIPVTSVLKKEFDGSAVVSVAPKNPSGARGLIVDMDETPENKHILDSLSNSIFKKMSGRDVFGCGFIRDLNVEEYAQTKRDVRLIEIFMVIAILLSVLAFLAMSMHYSSRNIKPVAIHKVFGGSSASEVKRCMMKYFKIMLPAFLAGLPLAYWISARYLEQFSYRFNLNSHWWIFLTAMLISVGISSAAVLWQTLRAARTNPAEALKKE